MVVLTFEADHIAHKWPHIDQETIDKIVALNFNDTGHYGILQWLNVSDPQTYLRRKQAFFLYPALVAEFYGKDFSPYSSSDIILFENVVDEARPLIPVLVNVLNRHANGVFTKAHIQRMQSAAYINLEHAAILTRTGPIDHFPKTPAEWKAVNIINIDLRGICAKLLGSYQPQEFKAFLSRHLEINPFRDSVWQKFAANDGIHGAGDSIAWFVKNIFGPVMLIAKDKRIRLNIEPKDIINKAMISMNDIIAAWSLPKIADMNQQWHKNIAKINTALKAYDEQVSPAIIRTWKVPYAAVDGTVLPEIAPYTIEPLASRKELDKETKTHGHCIENYAAACILGKSHIFRMRIGKGPSLSTFEVDNWQRIVQHEASTIDNEKTFPTEAEKKAAEAFCRALQEGVVPEKTSYEAWCRAARNFTHRQVYGWKHDDKKRVKLCYDLARKYGIISKAAHLKTPRAWTEEIGLVKKRVRPAKPARRQPQSTADGQKTEP